MTFWDFADKHAFGIGAVMVVAMTLSLVAYIVKKAGEQ